jgi:hypothetical protein
LALHHQAIVDMRDEDDDDADELMQPKTRRVGRLFKLILRCFRAFFSWKEFHHGTEQKATLDESLRAIRMNISPVDGVQQSQIPTESLVSRC